MNEITILRHFFVIQTLNYLYFHQKILVNYESFEYFNLRIQIKIISDALMNKDV